MKIENCYQTQPPNLFGAVFVFLSRGSPLNVYDLISVTKIVHLLVRYTRHAKHEVFLFVAAKAFQCLAISRKKQKVKKG